jgi:putative ABC transport system substrate-binding protein
VKVLQDALHDLGYVEGRNLRLDYHSADGKPDRLPELAVRVAALKFDVIVTTTNETTAAAQRATRTIPIVMVLGRNPVGLGFAASLSRPGGNITGLTFDAAPEAYAKPMEFLKEVLPQLSRVAVLHNAASDWTPMWNAARHTGKDLNIEVVSVDFRAAPDVDSAIQAMKKYQTRAFLFWPEPASFAARVQLAEAASRERLLGASLVRQYADAGGLMSYGPSLVGLFKQAAPYVDRILKGAKPSDLPVEQPRNYELVINMKTAKAMGIVIPPTLRLRADHLIE